tara:strand:- start:212 stop:712 length:501 start_codon:yes stop_codon:yes gene_type:complete
MIGCTLSHLKLWQKIIKSNDKNILILEDDVIFVKNFKKKFIEYSKQVPKDWDILYLGASNVYGTKINNNIIKPIYNSGHMTNVGAYAMLVKKESLKKLIKSMNPIKDDFDIQIKNKFNKFNSVYYFNPPLILHNNEIDSDRRTIDGSNPKAHPIWRNKVQSRITII